MSISIRAANSRDAEMNLPKREKATSNTFLVPSDDRQTGRWLLPEMGAGKKKSQRSRK